MLQTVYEQKIALATYANEHGGITMLTPNKIDLTRKIIEEITKMISKDSASISMLIPMVNILERAFNNKHEDDSGIQTMKGEMLKSLESRFDNIEGLSIVWTLDLSTYFFLKKLRG